MNTKNIMLTLAYTLLFLGIAFVGIILANNFLTEYFHVSYPTLTIPTFTQVTSVTLLLLNIFFFLRLSICLRQKIGTFQTVSLIALSFVLNHIWQHEILQETGTILIGVNFFITFYIFGKGVKNKKKRFNNSMRAVNLAVIAFAVLFLLKLTLSFDIGLSQVIFGCISGYTIGHISESAKKATVTRFSISLTILAVIILTYPRPIEESQFKNNIPLNSQHEVNSKPHNYEVSIKKDVTTRITQSITRSLTNKVRKTYLAINQSQDIK